MSQHSPREQIELILQRYPNGVTALEMAHEMECHISTIYRYLKELKDEELVIQEGSRYRVDPHQILSNVRLHPSEALAVYLGLRRFIRQTSHAPNFMLTALQKVVSALQHPQLMDSLFEAVDILREMRHASPQQEHIWQTLFDGWRENRVVRIHYLKREATEPTCHDIEIYLFEPMVFGDGTYVIAWSRQRNDLRTFKPDRIQKIMLTGETYKKPDHLSVNILLRHAWGIWYGKQPIKVELLFEPSVASRVLESNFLPTEEKILLEDGSLHWSAEVYGTREIGNWIRSWSHHVRVLTPENLRQQIIEDLRKALENY